MTRWYYAVGRGRQTGVFNSWADCHKQIENISNAKFRKFSTEAEAWGFVEQCKQNLTPIKSALGTQTSSSHGGTAPPPPSAVCRGLTSSFNKSEGNPVSQLMQLSAELKRHIDEAEEITQKFKYNLDMLIPSTPGKKCCPLCGATKKDDDLEEIPVPPKKLPKIEIESDDENEDVKNDSFDYDEEGYVIVYTDGACENNGRNNAKAGVGVWFKDNHPLNFSEPVVGRATNNNAEIQAAVHALEIVKKAGLKKVVVNTDSEFMINCMTKWITKWRRNGWNTATGKPVKNRSELILLTDAMEGLEVRWNHVRGHSGVYGNEMADRLARKGAERYICVPY